VKLQQLRYLCAIADNGYVISKAAKALKTSQPAISKQIRLLEDELDAILLRRNSTHILGLTARGEAVVEIARRVLADVEKLTAVARCGREAAGPKLKLVTTRLHAGFILPPILKAYRSCYPDVTISIVQEQFEATCAIVSGSNTCVGVVSQAPGNSWNFKQIPGYATHRALVFTRDHPIAGIERPTLEQLARYPIITLAPSYSGGKVVRRAFELAGLRPTYPVEAVDPASIKAYARLGLGVGVLARIAVDPMSDDLACVDAEHLFGSATGTIVLNPSIRMPDYMKCFVDMLADCQTFPEAHQAAA
jgi:LysR family cys regulon transcriptional activator